MLFYLVPRQSMLKNTWLILNEYQQAMGSIKLSLDRKSAQVLDLNRKQLGGVKVLAPSSFNKNRKLEIYEKNNPARTLNLESDSAYWLSDLNWQVRLERNALRILTNDGSQIYFDQIPFDCSGSIVVRLNQDRDLVLALLIWAGFALDMERVLYDPSAQSRNLPPRPDEKPVQPEKSFEQAMADLNALFGSSSTIDYEKQIEERIKKQEEKYQETCFLLKTILAADAQKCQELLEQAQEIGKAAHTSLLRARQAALLSEEKLTEFGTDRPTLVEAYLNQASRKVTEYDSLMDLALSWKKNH